MLEYKIKQNIRIKRRGLLSKGVILQHDNSQPHAAQLIRDKFRELGSKVLPYSS